VPLAVETISNLNRQIGIEMEGYTETNPKNFSIPNVYNDYDGSLRNGDWADDSDDDDDDGFCYSCDEYSCDCTWRERSSSFGVELTLCEPIRDLNDLVGIWSKMQEVGWHTGEEAGTHVHVDISDFTMEEKAKLLRFGKGIERIIFMFVRNYRLGNSYCRSLDEAWRRVFHRSSRFSTVDWEQANNDPYNDLPYWFGQNGFPRANNSKYHWMNVFGSSYPTVEFRLFNCVENLEQIQTFALMAYKIVEYVKNTDIGDINSAIRRMYRATTPEQAADRFCQTIGLGFTPPLIGEDAIANMYDRLNESRAVAATV